MALTVVSRGPGFALLPPSAIRCGLPPEKRDPMPHRSLPQARSLEGRKLQTFWKQHSLLFPPSSVGVTASPAQAAELRSLPGRDRAPTPHSLE